MTNAQFAERDADSPQEAASALEPIQESAVRKVANELHRLNHSIMAAVESGVTVELVRSSRHHGGKGNWGDMMVPVIVKR